MLAGCRESPEAGIAASDLGPPRAGPWPQETWLGLAGRSQERQSAVGQISFLHRNLTRK